MRGTKKTQKNTQRTQKKNFHTKIPKNENFLGGNAKTKGVVAVPPLLWIQSRLLIEQQFDQVMNMASNYQSYQVTSAGYTTKR